MGIFTAALIAEVDYGSADVSLGWLLWIIIPALVLVAIAALRVGRAIQSFFAFLGTRQGMAAMLIVLIIGAYFMYTRSQAY